MEEQQQFQVKASDEDLKGRFANAANVGHQQDLFFFDFFLALPPAGQLVSRVFTTPSHMKKLSKAISDQLKAYEKNFGPIDEAEDEKRVGFRA